MLYQQILNKFQVELHNLLCFYLNGCYLNKKSHLFYPFIDKINTKVFKTHFQRLYKLLSQLKINTEKRNVLFSFLKEDRFNSEEIAFIISKLYEIFDEILNNFKSEVKEIKIECKKNFDPSVYEKIDENYLKPAILLWKYANKSLKEYLLGFYIHGSISTLDYVKGYSDLDTLIIVKKDTIANYKKLILLRKKIISSLRFLFMLDPFQHHEHFIFTEYDMKYYPQFFFPLVIFNYSTSLLENGKILYFYERDCNLENLEILKKRLEYFKEKYEKQEIPNNLFEMKYFLSTIMLMPALYLQARGIYIYKKFSFEKARKDFPKKVWNIINQATKIRANWRIISILPKWVRELLKFYPNPIFLKVFDLKFNNKIPQWIMNILGNSYLENAYILAKEMFSKIS